MHRVNLTGGGGTRRFELAAGEMMQVSERAFAPPLPVRLRTVCIRRGLQGGECVDVDTPPCAVSRRWQGLGLWLSAYYMQTALVLNFLNCYSFCTQMYSTHTVFVWRYCTFVTTAFALKY